MLLKIILSAWLSGAAKQTVELPDGEGKKILETACTTCHTREGLPKYKDYYNEENWKDIVLTMKEYGTPVKDLEIPILVKYLVDNFGIKAP